MVHLGTIRIVVGFALKGLGFFWSLSDKFICSNLCYQNCNITQNKKFSFLILFVGIIFIVSGYALVVMKDKGRISLRKKIRKNIFLFKR